MQNLHFFEDVGLKNKPKYGFLSLGLAKKFKAAFIRPDDLVMVDHR